jgi:hypothetical protein
VPASLITFASVFSAINFANPVGSRAKETSMMTLTVEHISPIAALVAGILILILPNLLNYVVAIYLILIGLVGLNGIYHFMS